jgi:hypothetical protein
MPVQDATRDIQLVQLFNLYVSQDRRCDQTDAFLLSELVRAYLADSAPKTDTATA